MSAIPTPLNVVALRDRPGYGRPDAAAARDLCRRLALGDLREELGHLDAQIGEALKDRTVDLGRFLKRAALQLRGIADEIDGGRE